MIAMAPESFPMNRLCLTYTDNWQERFEGKAKGIVKQPAQLSLRLGLLGAA